MDFSIKKKTLFFKLFERILYVICINFIFFTSFYFYSSPKIKKLNKIVVLLFVVKKVL